MRTSTRSLTSTYVENITIDAPTKATPAVEIASRPPPIATIALPDTANTSAASVRARQRMTPSATSAIAMTAGYA